MFYCIDFDSRTVESKSETREALDSYVESNSLELALSIVDSPDELCLQFSIEEMKDIYGQLCGNPPEFPSEEVAAEATWEALEDNEGTFTTFTPKLAKKLLKKSKLDSQDSPKPESKPKPKKVSSTPRVTLDLESPLYVVDGKCKSGSILATIVTAIEDELCATIGEVIDYILENHVIPKTGELADEKFAHHNVKYFLKQGKLSVEEEL